MSAIIIVFKPLIWSLNGLGQQLLRVIGLRASANHSSIHSPHEIILLIRQSHAAGQLDKLEQTMLQKTFRFSETSVSEVMTPRLRVEGLDLKLSMESLLDAAAASSHTRLPVYRDTMDDIVGVIHTHDLFQYTRRSQPDQTLQNLIRTVIYVPESFRLDNLVLKFQKERTQIAVVIDEYGGTAGIITLEDIIETVFGEIQDSNGDPTVEIEEQADGTIILRGDTRLDDINEYFGWQLSDEESDTIAGYLSTNIGRLPQPGDRIKNRYGVFEISEMQRQRITQIIVHTKK